ncbi:sterol 24-C-methyltransferase [Irpex rosettiformis]|uniref:Sterol 24-C-methyltransferase n=1 Tax=Irpex rosettiformis TaxID=378272 RepID=A0ACB8UDP1_9APHY|nr:sterol 24-C-methyltransferase [Irpex rosettiformis]
MADDFHFSRIFRGDQNGVSRQRHKHYLFSRLGLKPGMTVLDVGCGSGSAALELARFANIRIWGVDTDPVKIAKANRKAQASDSPMSVTFVHVPFLEHAHQYFAPGSFDAVYAIESLRCVSNPLQLYTDLCGLLRSGGKFASYEWCWTYTFNPQDLDHLRLAELLEARCGMGSSSSTERTVSAMIAALQSARLSNVQYDDLGMVHNGASVPWYSVIDIALASSHTRWADSSGIPGALGYLTKEGATVMSEAGRLRLFTPMALVVGTRT